MRGAVRRIDGTALLLASFAAPGSSFLIWASGACAPSSPLRPGLTSNCWAGRCALLLAAVWGAIPAAVFGTPALLLTHRLFGAHTPLCALVLAGRAAASLYAACMLALAYAAQAWVFLPAPWTTGRAGRRTTRLPRGAAHNHSHSAIGRRRRAGLLAHRPSPSDLKDVRYRPPTRFQASRAGRSRDGIRPRSGLWPRSLRPASAPLRHATSASSASPARISTTMT